MPKEDRRHYSGAGRRPSSPLSVPLFGLASSIGLILAETLSNEEDISRAAVQVSTAAHDITQRLENWNRRKVILGNDSGTAECVV